MGGLLSNEPNAIAIEEIHIGTSLESYNGSIQLLHATGFIKGVTCPKCDTITKLITDNKSLDPFFFRCP